MGGGRASPPERACALGGRAAEACSQGKAAGLVGKIQEGEPSRVAGYVPEGNLRRSKKRARRPYGTSQWTFGRRSRSSWTTIWGISRSWPSGVVKR